MPYIPPTNDTEYAMEEAEEIEDMPADTEDDNDNEADYESPLDDFGYNGPDDIGIPDSDSTTPDSDTPEETISYLRVVYRERGDIPNYDPYYLEDQANNGAIFYAIYDDDTEVQVSWDEIQDLDPLSTDVDLSSAIASASNQHFWDDENGAHVAEISHEDWDDAVEDNFSDLSASKNYYNFLINSLGGLLRRALLKLVSINRGAISFYDGLGNEVNNIMASFGRYSAQIGKTNEKHVVIDNSGITAYNGDGSLAPMTGLFDGANITNSSITNAKIADSTITGSKIQGATLTDIPYAAIDNADIEVARVANAQISSATISQAQVENLDSDYAHITNGTIDNAKIDKADVTGLSATYATISNLNAATGRIESLETDNTNVKGRLTAAEGNISTLTTNKANVTDLTAATARITSLEGDHVSVADFEAEQANINTLQANTADIATIRANSAKVANLTAQQLEADHATVSQLDANFAHADMANVSNAWIENGTVKNGAISDAMIGSVSANKLTAGTIDASNITVTNLNADNITAGTINGQRIGEGSLSLSKLEDDVYTEAEVDAKLSTMQSQIDGAIETWTGTAVPTLQNSPASSWNTTALKDSHVGDVYFVVNSQSQQNGYNYRFTKSGSTYSWQLIKDNDVTNALQRLTDAEGRIGTIEQFDSTVSSYMTDTDEELSSIKSAATTLAGRVTTAEGTLATKVDTSTFNMLSQMVGENSSSIQTLSSEQTTLSGLVSTALEDSIEYVVGTQTAATGSWTGVTREASLATGKTIAYKLPYAGSGNASLTLTLSDGTTTEAIPVYTNTTRVTTHFGAGSVITMTYDGTNWRTQSIPNTNNIDRIQHNNTCIAASANETGMAYAVMASSVIGHVESLFGYQTIISGTVIDLSLPILWATGNVAATKTFTSGYEVYPSCTLRTNFANWTGTQYAMAYMYGMLNGNSLTVVGFTSTEPTTEDGYVYIPLGQLYSTYQIAFRSSKEKYAYVDGQFQPVEWGVKSQVTKNIAKVSEIDQTVDGITTRVGSLETAVATKADGSALETVSNNLSTLSQTVDTFQTTVASTYATKTEVDDSYAKTQSRGFQLVTNGNGFMGDNTNWPDLTFDGSVTNASPGSFTHLPNVSGASFFTDEEFPIDLSKEYLFEFDAKSGAGDARLYSAFVMLDVDKNTIMATNVFFYPLTLTTLAEDLNPGDTTVKLASAANWHATSYDHQRALTFWDYTNSYGYTYPENTYSRNYYGALYADDSKVDKSTGVITLKTAWTGPKKLAGTKVSQGYSGNQHVYPQQNIVVPSEWTHYSYTFSGLDDDFNGADNAHKFRQGTAFAKVGFLWNYGNSSKTQSQIWITNVSVKENVASATDLTSVTQRVTTAESTIEQHGTSIALKANSADVYTKTESDGMISTEVTNRNAAITAATEAIELSVSETYSTKQELSDLQIGGRNLLRSAAETYRQNAYLVYQKILTTFALNELEVGDSITIQLWGVDADTNSTAVGVYWGGPGINLAIQRPDANGYWKYTYTITQAHHDHAHAGNKWINIYNFPSNHDGSSLFVERWKIERGAKATDWTPAPEDLDPSISNLTPFFSSHNEDGTYPVGNTDGYWQPSLEKVYNRECFTALKDGWAHLELCNSAQKEFVPPFVDSLKQGDKVTMMVEWRNATQTGNGPNFYTRNYPNNVQLDTNWYFLTTASGESGTTYYTFTVSSATGEAAWNGLVDVTFTAKASSTWTGDIRISFYVGDYRGPYKPYSGDQLYATQTNLESAKAAIKVTTDGISTEVAKKVNGTEIISAINQSAESVKIQASKVEIDGTAIFTAISNDVDDAITDKGYQTASQVNTAITSKGYATTTQAQGYASTAKSEAISAAATDATSKANAAEANAKAAIPSDISELNNDSGFITSADVPTKVSDLTNDANYATTTQAQGYATTAKTEAISAAAADATTKANAVQTNLDNLQIGGRNLIAVGNVYPFSGNYKNTYYCEFTYGNGRLKSAVELEAGVTYTFSVDVESDIEPFKVSVGCGSSSYSKDIYTVDATASGRVSMTFTPTEAQLASGAIFAFRAPRYTSVKTFAFTVNHPKLERGTKPTDWTPAPEDTDADISAVQSMLNASRTWYAECSTVAATAAKVATITPATTDFASNFNVGTMVNVKFTETNSAAVANLTLSVNGTAAKPIKFINNDTIANIPAVNYLIANAMYQLMYDGTYWVIQNLNYNTNTTYNLGVNQHSSAIKAKSAITRYFLICGDENGYQHVEAGATFKLGYPILYAQGGAIAANGTATNTYETYPGATFSTTGTIVSGAANLMLYLKVTISGNVLTVAPSPFMTTVVPTAEDGYVYIPLGIMTSETAGYFQSSKDLYAYLDGAFRQVTPTEIVATQRIYYRCSVSTATPDTAISKPSGWVTESGDKRAANLTTAANWSLKKSSIAASTAEGQTKYLYLYTCEQRKRLDGTVDYTTVVIDDATTVIDGATIVTNSITATQIAANTITADQLDANNIKTNIVQTTDLNADRITSGTIDAARINTAALVIGDSTLGTTLNAKADSNDIPTAVSDLTNDTGFITSADVPDQMQFYGTCGTAAGTATKTVVCDGFEAVMGTRLTVQSSTANTADAPTLLVQSTAGATLLASTAVWYNNVVASGSNPVKWASNSTHSFIYDGTHWVLDEMPPNYMGTSTSAATTPSKALSVAGALVVNGTTVNIKLDNGNTYVDGALTFNLSSTGAGNIYRDGVITSATNTLEIAADTYVTLVRAGSGWRLADNGTRTMSEDASKTATNYISADSTGIRIANADPATATTYQHQTATETEFVVDGISQLWMGTSGNVAGMRIGQASQGNVYASGDGYVDVRNSSRVMAHFGYGDGNAGNGTSATAPYYTLGTRKTTTTAFSTSETYEVGDHVLYNSVEYVCHSAVTTAGDWTGKWNWWVAIGNYSVAEGNEVIACGTLSHAEGRNVITIGAQSHAEGGYGDFAYGYPTMAVGVSSHAEGGGPISINDDVVTGGGTQAIGDSSHAEGSGSIASGSGSHAEGYSSVASGSESHAEGYRSVASGSESHAQNLYTIATGLAQTAIGKFNVEDTNNIYALIIGNGMSDSARSNALTVDWNGNLVLAGGITLGTPLTAAQIPNLAASKITSGQLATAQMPTGWVQQYMAGATISGNVRCMGFVTDSTKSLRFTIPLSRPVQNAVTFNSMTIIPRGESGTLATITPTSSQVTLGRSPSGIDVTYDASAAISGMTNNHAYALQVSYSFVVQS